MKLHPQTDIACTVRESRFPACRPWPLGRCVFGCALLLLSWTANAAAELQPSELAIIAMARSPESQEVAEYYARARGIPETHICLLDLPLGETLARSDWELRVRPAIRRWILENQLETKLRCLVTVWDVPLKVGRDSADSPGVGDRLAYLTSERRTRVHRLRKLLDQVKGVLADKEAAPPATLPADVSTKDLIGELDAAFKAAQKRILAREKDAPETKAALNSLKQSLVAAGGLNSVMQSVKSAVANSGQADPKVQAEIQLATGRMIGLREGKAALEAISARPHRDEQILTLLEKSDGLAGTLKWIDGQLDLLQKNETYASFDSELSLLFWLDYPRLRWQPNVLHHRYDGSYARWMKVTLMVSRLEAPTVALTKKLIDTAKETESQGLTGTIYLDARGIGKLGQTVVRGSYADYDQAVQKLAEDLLQYTKANIRLDTRQELFQAGDCRDAALYCGWYSLSKYVDAFDWNPGAVGYHMASGEAATLRHPQSQVWCKRMLEDGICATVGPVYEPYLAAFPRPDEFFVVLMSGRYTLAETYYRTKPFNSWVMVLVGDPLYNPFKNNPQFRVESLPERLRGWIEYPEENLFGGR